MVDVVDKARLKKSIIFCSFIILAGRGGSASASVLHEEEVDTAGMPTSTGTRAPFVPPEL